MYSITAEEILVNPCHGLTKLSHKSTNPWRKSLNPCHGLTFRCRLFESLYIGTKKNVRSQKRELHKKSAVPNTALQLFDKQHI